MGPEDENDDDNDFTQPDQNEVYDSRVEEAITGVTDDDSSNREDD